MSGLSAGLSRGMLWRVFARSLFLQAAWNPQGMQNLGLAYALYPALRALYPDPKAQSEAVQRHLTFFNTHPYAAAAILGGVLRHEERIARQEAPAQAVVAFKSALMGPLAALGDGFFWLSLRPAVGAVSVATVPWLHGWAAVLFLVLYNGVHLFFRARLFWLGWTLEDRLVEALAKVQLPKVGAKLRALAAGAAGAAAAYLALSFGAGERGPVGWLLVGGCLLLGAGAYVGIGRRWSRYAVLYLTAGLAVAAGAWL